MHQTADLSRKKYEARVYNEWVRLLIDTGELNVTGFADAWADNRLIEVEARSISEAMIKLQSDYPEGAGFKITAILEIPDASWPRTLIALATSADGPFASVRSVCWLSGLSHRPVRI